MNVVETLTHYVKKLFASDATGHDFYHTLRVYRMAMKIAEEETCDKEIILFASLLHDVDDPKLFHTENYLNARNAIRQCGLSIEKERRIIHAIQEVSFRASDSVIPSSIEGKIVQDADRLDAIGAIGIARAFAYGGAKNRKMYDPIEKPLLNMDEKTYRSHQGSTINHFYEKLLLIPSMLNTEKAKKIAQGRMLFMKQFLDEFYAEWEEK